MIRKTSSTNTQSHRHIFKHYKEAPFQTKLPESIYFRSAMMPAEATYPKHQHPWGEFVYSFSGLMEITLKNCHYLAPPQYGIWLPPHVEHTGFNHCEACHCSLYISEENCTKLPKKACALMLNPVIHAMLEQLKEHPFQPPYNTEQQRFLEVLSDQLALAPCAESYLPYSQDPILEPILQQLTADPSNSNSLMQLAQIHHTTERTLIRRAQRDLGMSLTEWRQRLKIVKALPLLEAGITVESIAFDLGYNSASAFIVMFKNLMGTTPAEFRKRKI